MQSWHNPQSGALNLVVGNWFKMTLFATNERRLEISIRIFKLYKVLYV